MTACAHASTHSTQHICQKAAGNKLSLAWQQVQNLNATNQQGGAQRQSQHAFQQEGKHCRQNTRAGVHVRAHGPQATGCAQAAANQNMIQNTPDHLPQPAKQHFDHSRQHLPVVYVPQPCTAAMLLLWLQGWAVLLLCLSKSIFTCMATAPAADGVGRLCHLLASSVAQAVSCSASGPPQICIGQLQVMLTASELPADGETVQPHMKTPAGPLCNSWRPLPAFQN